jgi:hypothetical protein
MQPQFRIEHIATVPHGYKVRTVKRAGHEVRIAFPPGRRTKGSGRVVEVLHPAHENPCRIPNPAELLVMTANPAELLVMGANPDSKLEGASRTYEEFHGESGKHIDEIHEPSPRPMTLAELGTLIELRVKRPTGWKWGSFDFTGRGVRLASNVAGTQLYFVDGDQKVSRGELTHLGADNSKELIDLGECLLIAYRARKMQVNGVATNYEHNFGEETGVRPRLMYDRRGPAPRLYLNGGAYRVEARGIIN